MQYQKGWWHRNLKKCHDTKVFAVHIIMGATGRVGSAVVSRLLEKEQSVKGITRNADKASPFQ